MYYPEIFLCDNLISPFYSIERPRGVKTDSCGSPLVYYLSFGYSGLKHGIGQLHVWIVDRIRNYRRFSVWKPFFFL